MLPLAELHVPSSKEMLTNVRKTLVAVAVAAMLIVTLVPETAVTVVPVTIPVPLTELPTTIVELAKATVIAVLPNVVLPVVNTLLVML